MADYIDEKIDSIKVFLKENNEIVVRDVKNDSQATIEINYVYGEMYKDPEPLDVDKE